MTHEERRREISRIRSRLRFLEMVEVAIAGTQQVELVSISAEGKPEAESAAMIKRVPVELPAGTHLGLGKLAFRGPLLISRLS